MAASLRVLIVDDNAAIRMILSDMLADLGHQVVGEADDLDAALKAYAEHKPDLVTLDLSLSAIGGAAFVGKPIKEEELTAALAKASAA